MCGNVIMKPIILYNRKTKIEHFGQAVPQESTVKGTLSFRTKLWNEPEHLPNHSYSGKENTAPERDFCRG
jgi:hypothetical protein